MQEVTAIRLLSEQRRKLMDKNSINHLNTSYIIDGYLFICKEDNYGMNYAKLLKLSKYVNSVEELIAKVKENNIATIYKIGEKIYE